MVKVTLSLSISEVKMNWKGGILKDYHGYTVVWLDKDNFFHPMTNNRNYVYEHRLEMAKHLGRCLHSWEVVHHKNGIRSDNRLENLEIIVRGSNHHFGKVKCPYCNKEFNIT